MLPAAGVAAGVLLPLGYLGVRALEADPAELAALLLRPQTLALLGRTLGLAAGVLAFDLLIAWPLAWLTVRTPLVRVPGLALVGALPLAVPGYVMAYALLALGGGRGPHLAGFWGALLALGLTTYPYLYLNLRTALLALDPGLEEAARSLGHRPASVFLRVVLPALRPAFLAGGLLVALHVLGDFGVVSLMRYPTFSYAIYLQYTASFDRTYAAWLALMLLALAALGLALEARLLRGARPLGRPRPRRRPPPAPLWATALGAVWALLAGGLGVGLPLAVALRWLGAGAGLAGVLPAAAHSLLASLPAALLAALLAYPLARLEVRRPSPLAGVLARVAYFGYAVPPLALALAWIFFGLRAAPFLYQTLAMLVLAYTLHFLAEALGPVRSALYQTPRGLEEAARSLGHRPASVFLRVVLPSVGPGLAAGAAFVFLSAMKELPLTFLLAPLGFDTLATNAWSYASEAMFAEAAPYALALLAVSAALVGPLLGRRRDRR